MWRGVTPVRPVVVAVYVDTKQAVLSPAADKFHVLRDGRAGRVEVVAYYHEAVGREPVCLAPYEPRVLGLRDKAVRSHALSICLAVNELHVVSWPSLAFYDKAVVACYTDRQHVLYPDVSGVEHREAVNRRQYSEVVDSNIVSRRLHPPVQNRATGESCAGPEWLHAVERQAGC